MASSQDTVSPGRILAAQAKLNEPDPDFRFMALNDLLQLLNRAGPHLLQHEYNVAAKTIDNVISTLDDQNGEVQNLAIKCLGPLVEKIPTSLLGPLIEKLSNLKLQNAVDLTVPSLALRTVIIALPRPVLGLPQTPAVSAAYDALSRVLVPRLIGVAAQGYGLQKSDTQGLLNDHANLNVEAVDVLIEVVRCFGSLLKQIEVEAMQAAVMRVLESGDASSVVKKRAVVALAMLAVYLDSKNLEGAVASLLQTLSSRSTCDAVTRRLYISILGSMARSIPTRFGVFVPQAAQCVLAALTEEELQDHLEKVGEGDDLGQDFNEVREAALVTLEAFLASCPAEMHSLSEDTIAASLRYLKYDPNYSVDDEVDDDEMDEDEPDEDDEDDEFEEDDGFEDDDDDASWKARRCAAKIVYALIASRSNDDLLANGIMHAQVAPALIKRLDEREENVRLEVVAALSQLVRRSGDGIPIGDSSLLEMVPDVTSQMPNSRKRRRQSSTANVAGLNSLALGLTSPAPLAIPSSGPRADLARLTPSMVKAAKKQLQSKSIATRQAVLGLLGDIVSTQRGGLSEFLPELMPAVTDAIKSPASAASHSNVLSSGGSSSATPSTLRTAALVLVSLIARTHSSTVLSPFIGELVEAVAAAAHDRFYKISSEAIRSAEEMIKAITPPRSLGTGSKHKESLQQLYKVVLDRASASDADAEVRSRAIQALGVLLSRTLSGDETVLLSSDQRQTSLDVLKDRLVNETTRLAAVRAIDNVALFSTSTGQLEPAWIQLVALELSAQLRKANRTLRGSSIMALKHLVLSEAAKGQLEASTVQGIMSALMPVITAADTHLLGPALAMLALLVKDNSGIVMTEEMNQALCRLLAGHFASIVLEPLLDFISNAGQSGAGSALMKSILKDVSVQGDPSVVGRVIGTLLVTGGSSGDMTLDNFVDELKVSSAKKDVDRTCLALAVLGEAAMRLGDSSAGPALDPEIFLNLFSPEPDKVSLSAAVALGRAGSGGIQVYVPKILQSMQEGGTKQYLLIQSIKEILQSTTSLTANLQAYSDQVWEELLKASVHGDNRAACAECVGRLVTLKPGQYMAKLEPLLHHDSVAVRSMAVQAVRYMLPESDEAFDAALRTVLVDMMLTMLKDPDMEVRRLAMTTLNSAAHNKPDLTLPHLSEMLPFVLQETAIKPELVREVTMGPFKHTVDDGLEVRKTAYETLYALMDSAFSRINGIAFFDRVIAGLKDDNDIRQLCNLMVTKLIVMEPTETARRLDSIAEAYRIVLSVKLKDNAVKQDIEKQEESQKSVLRVTLLLGEKMKAMTGNAGAATSIAVAGAWTSYWDWVNKDFEKQLGALQRERTELQTTTL